ncbi:hypothetical protein SDC9_150012 [bioreactor metagenome]|uniref:Uncharacterized protein n=1 Tax=bioreactor metagenome TaxID=1076179 RepID=A0A645EL75_9ZZZZ
MANANTLTKVRDILIALTMVLMILVVVFQTLEIQKFELMDIIKTRITAIFGSGQSATAEPAAAPAAAPEGAPAADNAHGTSGIKNAVDAKRTAEADAGL